MLNTFVNSYLIGFINNAHNFSGQADKCFRQPWPNYARRQDDSFRNN